ncbi:MAG: hypothetical protein O3A21_03825 [Proteobacteria bacterium]|nr:hypothetical protein [Pseudomonadota bacterium]
MKEVSGLIDDILAIDDLLPSTREDLDDFKRDLAEGQLGKEDREYIAALHERLVGGGGVSTTSSSDDDDEDDEDDSEFGTDAVEVLEAEIEELKQTLAARDARIAELESDLEAVKISTDKSSPV